MPNVMVVLSGSASDTAYTDAGGNYSFSNLNAGGTFTVTPHKDTNDQNGVTTYDLVLISKHILGLEPFSSPWKILASDANKSNTVTTFDIVEGRKVILGINSEFPSNTSWRFFPADLTFADPNDPFTGMLLTESISLENLQQNVSNIHFRGVKICDTNNSADPGQ
jgi:large repetitive protein